MTVSRPDLSAEVLHLEAGAHRRGWGTSWTLWVRSYGREGWSLAAGGSTQDTDPVAVLLTLAEDQDREELVVIVEGWVFPEDVAAAARAEPDRYGPAMHHPRRVPGRMAFGVARDGTEVGLRRRGECAPEVFEGPVSDPPPAGLVRGVLMAARRVVGRPSAETTPDHSELVARVWLAGAAQMAATAYMLGFPLADAVLEILAAAALTTPDWETLHADLREHRLFGTIPGELLARMDLPMVAVEVLGRLPSARAALDTFGALMGPTRAAQMEKQVLARTGYRLPPSPSITL